MIDPLNKLTYIPSLVTAQNMVITQNHAIWCGNRLGVPPTIWPPARLSYVSARVTVEKLPYSRCVMILLLRQVKQYEHTYCTGGPKNWLLLHIVGSIFNLNNKKFPHPHLDVLVPCKILSLQLKHRRHTKFDPMGLLHLVGLLKIDTFCPLPRCCRP